jgi:hypothetical protein
MIRTPGDRDRSWKTAQTYEQAWWDARKQTVDFEFYREFAKDMLERFGPILGIGKNTAVLEIGS